MSNRLWLVVVAVAFACGWVAADWRRDSLELAISNAAQAAGNESRQAMQAVASESGRALENKLEAIRDGQPKEIRTEIVKPVFTHVCVSDEFVSMFNSAAEKAERALSGKPKNEVPGKSATN